MSTVHRVMYEAASCGLNGAPSTSGKNGNMLFLATGVSKWILVPSLKAFITCEANWFGAVNQRTSRASPSRGRMPR